MMKNTETTNMVKKVIQIKKGLIRLINPDSVERFAKNSFEVWIDYGQRASLSNEEFARACAKALGKKENSLRMA